MKYGSYRDAAGTIHVAAFGGKWIRIPVPAIRRVKVEGNTVLACTQEQRRCITDEGTELIEVVW